MARIVNDKSKSRKGNANMEVDLDFEDKMSNEDIESTGLLLVKSKRKLRSAVWNFFDILPTKANEK